MEKAAIFNEASTESNFIYTDENVIPTEEGTIRSGGFKASKIGEKSDFEKSLDLELNSEPEIIAEPITKQANISVPSSSLNQNSSTIITSMETIFPVKNTHSTGSPTKAFDSQTETDAEIYDAALKNFEEGQLIRGNIIDIDKSGIYMDINFKCEGFISNEELGMDVNKIKSEYKIGDPVSACIIKIETKEGYTLLSKKKADYEQNWLDAQNALKTKEIVTIDVINAVTGGLVVAFNQLKGFIPGSHIIKDKTQALKDLVGTKMEARFIDVDRKRKKIILSNKLANKADNVKRDDLFNEIEAGQVRKGKVTSLKSFGAFVNLGGVEGLIHISELSWDRIESPEDILKIGDIIDVFILGVDKESKKVSLGLKQLQQDP